MPEKKRTRSSFDSRIADISKSHLLELMVILSSYKDGLVIVGGWVPYLLLSLYQEDTIFQHIGSQDIDIAVNPKVIDEERYATLVELLEERGYELKEGTKFSYIKKVKTALGEDTVQVDFLGPEYGGTTKSHRHQQIQDNFFLRKAHGADIVFDHTIDFELEGTLPSGAIDKRKIKIADIVGILTMKGIVLGERYSEKDAYDLYSLVTYYKKGAESVAEAVKPFKENGLVKESLEYIREKFASRETIGPNWVADFEDLVGENQQEERERVKTAAYQQIKRFLELLEK